VRELSLHLLDLLENACEAGATEIDVEIVENTVQDELIIKVTDNGRGMTREQLERAFDPFTTSRQSRRVGLGLPLLKAAAEQAGGDVSIESRPGCTKVVARFVHSHIDRAPLGDVADSLMAVLLRGKEIRLRYRHHVDDTSLCFDSKEVEQMLGGVAVSHPDIRNAVRSYLVDEIGRLRARVSP